MRSSGVLMHITSLPGPYGVGTMGKQAFAFVDFLKEAGQTYWQILPLTPTGYGDSPYQSCCSYAGNPYLIDLESLIKEKLLKKSDVAEIDWCWSETKVDFGRQYNNRLNILRKAYDRFQDKDEAFAAFCAEQSGWLKDFALYMALKGKYNGKAWYEWDADLKFRNVKAINKVSKELAADIRFYSFVQYLFYKQWNALHAYAKENGVRIIGDVPIYVPIDSVEVWCEPSVFQLDENLNPTAVAGCPPDAFSADGQLWGNPLYDWDKMKKNGYKWWIRRLAAAGQWYDVVRMDHFRGLEAYWRIPAGAATAKEGKWVKGPCMDFINAIKKKLPQLEMIAEDLGTLTQEVLDLRDESGFPGMKVLGFAFDSREPSDYLPYFYPRNAVVYTGTHDNMTMRQWFETANPDAVAYATEYMNLSKKEGLVLGTIRTAMSSVADMCIIQMPDWLDLGDVARMNFPGTLSDCNWTWRAKNGMMSKALAKKIREMTTLYGRLGQQK